MTSPAVSRRNAPVWVTGLLAVLGVVLVVVAVVYFAESAGSLPAFFPGHSAGSTHHHTTHGIAALVLGLVALLGAWMAGGSREQSGPVG